MGTKRILRVYFDLPNFVQPKEVGKVFSMFRERSKLKKEQELFNNKRRKNEIVTELFEINTDIGMLLDVITPTDSNYSVQWHTSLGKEFAVLTITEDVQDVMPTKGQDEL